MKKYLLVLTSAFIITSVNAQVKVGTSAGAPHASSVMELESTSKGFLPPRMTTAQRDAISSPAVGLVVYNTERACLETYDGSIWDCIAKSDAPVTSRFGRLGSTFTTPHGSASTAFSTNTDCSNKIISTGYTPTNCAGTTTVGANSYSRVFINGQCWLQTNLKEFPNAFSGYTTTSWLNTPADDKGYWGYYNASDTTGASGWGATEPFAGAGLIYQWSAAMNNSITERAQGVCPTGFHVPSDCEWKFLEHGLGMSVATQDSISTFRTSGNVGSQLGNFTSGGTNSSGFTALISPSRLYTTGAFGSSTGGLGLWTSTSDNTTNTKRAIRRGLTPSSTGVQRNPYPNALGSSLRCLRD